MKKMTILAAAAALACLWGCEDPLVNDIIAEVSVSPASVTFESEGGTLKVAVTANVDFDITGAANWLKVEKSDKELAITAEANTVNEARSCELTLTAGDASAKVTVNQKAGSPYPGYTVCARAGFEYSGTMLYQFLKPSEEDYGGQGYLALADEDNNGLAIWIYTDLFESEEEVTLTPGTYVKGNDVYPALCGKKLTFAPGVLVSFSDDEDDSFIGGSYYVNGTTEQQIALVDGKVEVVAGNNGSYTIKADMVDAEGNAYKYVFEGQVEIDAEGATYPTGRIDVANTVFAAVCYYLGNTEDNGATKFALQLYSGDPENYATTNFDFYTQVVEYSEGIDISGTYTTPDEEEGTLPCTPGTLDFGVMTVYETPFGTFQFPSGAFVQYGANDYLVGDGFDSLMLTKEADGKYTINMAAIMSSDGNMEMFMGITGLEIPIVDPYAQDAD